MGAKLNVIQGPEQGMTIELGLEPLSIGRRTTNQLVLTDPQVSRLHCTILPAEGHFRIADAGSNNGTLVNGLRITEQPLQNGDQIQLGDTMLRFELVAALPEAIEALPATGDRYHHGSPGEADWRRLYHLAAALLSRRGTATPQQIAQEELSGWWASARVRVAHGASEDQTVLRVAPLAGTGSVLARYEGRHVICAAVLRGGTPAAYLLVDSEGVLGSGDLHLTSAAAHLVSAGMGAGMGVMFA